MKRSFASTAVISMGVFAVILIVSCKSGLNENQKLFLDYAKLENRYSNSGFYNNFDLYNLNEKPPIYNDSAFNFADFKTKLKKNFKLLIKGNEISPSFGDLDLQYPHQYVIEHQKDGSVNVKFSVFVPNTYYKFSVDKSDVGKTLSKDSAEVTLLDMTNDGVTLMVVNKAKKQSYDYTYDNADRKDFSGRQKYSQPKQPGYDDELFISDGVETPNRSVTNDQDSLTRTDFSRLNISVLDEKGKTLVSEGRINDFRHYLWYRNNDMPYPELTSAYNDLRKRYKETDLDSLHKFNPIYIVNLKASGKIGRVEFFLRSNKGHVETIDLGNVMPQKQEPQTEQVIDEHDEMLPIANITKVNVSKLLKINCVTVPVKLDEANYVLVYASVPYGYNNKNLSLTFDSIKVIGDKRDTLVIADFDDANDYFSVGSSYRNANLRAIKFAPKMQNAQRVIGKISLSVGNYYDKTYDIEHLPKGITLSADGLILSTEKDEPLLENIVDLYAFDESDGAKPLATVRQKNYDYSSRISTNHYVKKVNKIVIRYKKKDAELEQEIPFELLIPQKEKEGAK